MNYSATQFLLSDKCKEIIDQLSGYDDTLSTGKRLRRLYPEIDPSFLSAAVELYQARLRGRKKFSRAYEMFFTREAFEEIPESRLLTPDVDKIIDEVCKYYKVKESELRVSKRGYFNEPRNVGVYLIRQLRNDSLKKVGEVFGIKKYSTVSSIVERVKEEIGRNRKFKKRIHELTGNFIKSQRQT